VIVPGSAARAGLCGALPLIGFLVTMDAAAATSGAAQLSAIAGSAVAPRGGAREPTATPAPAAPADGALPLHLV